VKYLPIIEKKARLDGFRPGKVPQGLINKMYRKPVLMEEVGKILQESVFKYFNDEKMYIIGEPLPHEDDKEEIDWDSDTEFEFAYDIALAPDPDLNINDKTSIKYYKLKIDQDIFDKNVDQVRSRFGNMVDTDKISGNELIRADVEEVDSDSNIISEGVKVEDTPMHLEFMKDEDSKKLLTGLVVNDQIVFDIKKAYPNETDLAALLRIDKEKLDSTGNMFRITIKNIKKFEKAEIGQELFDKVYGKDTVKSEEEFNIKVSEEIAKSFERNSDYKFQQDARKYLVENFNKELPDEFFKRWLLAANDKDTENKLTEEQLEKDYTKYAEDLKWQLIKSKIVRENNIEVSDEELVNHLTELYRMQFMQYYGTTGIPDETLEQYARETLAKNNERNKFTESMLENKVYDFIKNNVKLDTNEVTLEEFNKLLEK